MNWCDEFLIIADRRAAMMPGSKSLNRDEFLFKDYPTRSDKYYMLSLLHKAIENESFFLDGVDCDPIGNEKTTKFVDQYGIDAALDLLPKMLVIDNYHKALKANFAHKEYYSAYDFKDWDGSLSTNYEGRLYLKVYKWYTAIPVFDIHD